MSDKDTTIATDGLGQMLDQFKQSTNLRLLASSYLNQVQAFEDALWPLLGERSLDSATGNRLDQIGEIISIPRGGRTDTAYRLALRTELAVLQSNGAEEDLVTVADLILQEPTTAFEFVEYFPKTVVMRPINDAVSGAFANPMATALNRAASAATRVWLVTSLRLDSITYTLSSSTSLETSSSLGLANDAQTTGGRLAVAWPQ